ncbi:hypothetical protein [Candidatus Aciduliprofundum boonei]|uniref:Uncharacterized protein n=1 Tax=Aciduliprofundum boonei (strain DSM 19572 / T469) TaxID=439481 RepID=D3T9N6_ACIB4|nr:hypothetical protein [Candidatus Aciduliprofundum boonei]ADD08815.1 conserved hypothetical protein [Aciduliprofundum boonei T469]HII55412.1 hypothetical protein [Candidatus Aciduliprofundum boonei]
MNLGRVKRKIVFLGKMSSDEDTQMLLDILEDLITELEVMDEEVSKAIDGLIEIVVEREKKKEGKK